jgi:CubicO group peptidase (beta-lactamase class C family)
VNKVQFRVLYRQFLFRIVDLEVLSAHAKGDSGGLISQFVSLLVFTSMCLALLAGIWAANTRNDRVPPLMQLISAWTMEHFLIASTMLVVGLFAVLSWESTFPDRRDVLVLGPLPVSSRTLFLAKVAAAASALGLTLAALHVLAGLAWPLALAQYNSTPAPALVFDPALPPVRAADFPAVMSRDIAPMLRRLDLAASDGGAGIVIGVSEHGVRRIMTYGAAKPDSLFEIGSITKTFTGLLLAQMVVRGELDLRDPVRDLLPPGVASKPSGLEITLLDLATHHSGLPRMPDNAGPDLRRETYTDYRDADLYDFVKQHGLERPEKPEFLYSNLGFALLGTALADHAGIPYAELLRREIIGPLGMTDTAISLPPNLLARLMQGHDGYGRPTPRWDLEKAFAGAGGIRSDAADMLTYLEAQMHPERSPFPRAIVQSHVFQDYVTSNIRIGLAWVYDPERGIFEHGGATGGHTSFAFFDPRRDFAAVGFLNAYPVAFPFIEVLSEHVRGRLAGEPALSLAPVSVPPAGPVRTFLAYGITMFAAGVFMFCCVLGIQGLAAQFLPRRWFLRASAWLQLAMFCLLVSGFFLLLNPARVLVTGGNKPWIAWIPSYWFLGLFQQLSGGLHPALEPFARRAWLGLAVAICATAVAYAGSYFRTLRRIVEEPDIASGFRSAWLPRFGGAFETAIVHFSIRSQLRSRQHRMLLAFYLGVAFALAILFLKAPGDLSAEITGDAWAPLSVQLLASTILLVGFWVVGVRVVFSLPLDLRANWMLRVMPFEAGGRCLHARRRAVLAMAVAPACAISAAVLFSLWPWRPAAAHAAVLVLLGIILAEFSFEGVQKIPFTCSYLPGRSNVHLMFWIWIFLLISLTTGTALNERKALQNSAETAWLLAVLAIAALFVVMRNNRLARPRYAELRYEEVPPDQVLSLDIS